MPERNQDTESSQASQGGTATQALPKPATQPRSPQPLPPWNVLLHNDDKNEIEYVVVTIMSLTALNQQLAVHRTLEAHKSGVSLLLTTHKERAELYRDQFESKGLVVSIELAS